MATCFGFSTKAIIFSVFTGKKRNGNLTLNAVFRSNGCLLWESQNTLQNLWAKRRSF